MEKIEAISKRYAKETEASSFVRHYEDAWRIIDQCEQSPEELAQQLADMQSSRDIKHWPGPDDPAFNPDLSPVRWAELERAWKAIEHMFWGERVSLEECADRIRRFLVKLGEAG